MKSLNEYVYDVPDAVLVGLPSFSCPGVTYNKESGQYVDVNTGKVLPPQDLSLIESEYVNDN